MRNFALTGSRIEHVIADQLQSALAAPADVISCFVGNRYGHQIVAAEVVKELQGRGRFLAVEPLVAVPVRRGAADLAHVAWVSGYVRQNWKRWREEIAESKVRQSGSAS